MRERLTDAVRAGWLAPREAMDLIRREEIIAGAVTDIERETLERSLPRNPPPMPRRPLPPDYEWR